MKSNVLTYAALAIGLLLSSCSDEFLDNQPLSTLTTNQYYSNPDEIEIALNGVYNILSANQVQGFGNNSTFSRNMMVMLNGATDEAFVRDVNINPNYVDWGDASFTAQSNFVNESWVFLYAGINRANTLLEKIEAVEEFEGNRKEEIIAEARLLRGFYHMMLSMMHGGIPVMESTSEDVFKARNTIQEVYASVIADYEFAYQTLPNRSMTLGRANKWTAAGLLAKAHTYLASANISGLNGFIEINSFDWVNSNENYTAALTYTQAIIDGSGYVLTPNYDYLFRETTKQQQYDENLFHVEGSNDPSTNVVNIVVNAFVPQGNMNTRGGGFGWFRPASELYNKYIEQDVRRDHNVTGNLWAQAEVELIEGIRYYVPRPLPSLNNGFLCIGKYRMIDPALKSIPNWASNINLPLIRYADVLLMHAEAQFFLGDETAARNTVSIVRSRALSEGISVSDLNNAYFKANFVEELLDERSRELCYENWRRIDLARFNKYDEVINNLSEEIGFYNIRMAPVIKSNWRPERVWFPIPTIQLDLNANLIQNQSY